MLRDVVGTVAQRDAQLNELTAENEKLQSLIVTHLLLPKSAQASS